MKSEEPAPNQPGDRHDGSLGDKAQFAKLRLRIALHTETRLKFREFSQRIVPEEPTRENP